MSRIRIIYPNWQRLDEHDRISVMLGNVLDDRTHYEHQPAFDCEMDGDPFSICEQLFHTHNAINRPNALYVRSMSCGDIIEIDGVEYVCRTVGFDRI